MVGPRLVKPTDELSALPPELAAAIRAYIDRTVAERVAELRAEELRGDRDLENAFAGVSAALKRRQDRKHKMRGSSGA